MESPVYEISSNFYEKAKSYAATFNPCVIMDSCQIQTQNKNQSFKLLLGFGGKQVVVPELNKLETLYNVWENHKQWMFGVLGYNLKNEIEKLDSLNEKCFEWPDLSFFIPETVLTISWDNVLQIHSENPQEIFKSINSHQLVGNPSTISVSEALKVDFTQVEHAQTIREIKEEILNGNVYELNYCSKFLSNRTHVNDTFHFYQALIGLSPSPFSAYYREGDKVLMSASPERYLRKEGHKLISQPMKGTRPRGHTKLEDQKLKGDLETDLKDRAENVMIVDLVRNDLSRVSVPGSVKVDELFKVYSFAQVHQMVSTVTSQLDTERNWKDAIKASFPMGSMTGAPKISAMKWIEKFEKSNREWYSGAFGYINPAGDFDFNVLIRTAFYDSSKECLAFYAGGAITIDSEEDKEYEEMLVKATAIKKVIQLLKA